MSSLLFALLVPGPPGSRHAVLRDRTADALAVLVALAYGAIMVPLGDATSAHAAIPWPVDVAIGVAAAPALLLRRRRPLGLYLALLPLGAISVMATGPILVALFTVAIRRRAALVLGLGAVHVGTSVVYYALQHDPPFELWVDLLLRSEAIEFVSAVVPVHSQILPVVKRFMREHPRCLRRSRDMGFQLATLSNHVQVDIHPIRR